MSRAESSFCLAFYGFVFWVLELVSEACLHSRVGSLVLKAPGNSPDELPRLALFSHLNFLRLKSGRCRALVPGPDFVWLLLAKVSLI